MKVFSDEDFSDLRQRVISRMATNGNTAAETLADTMTIRAIDACVTVLREYQSMSLADENSRTTD